MTILRFSIRLNFWRLENPYYDYEVRSNQHISYSTNTLVVGNVGIYKLLNMKVFTAAFPLHDGPVDVDPLDRSVPVSVLRNTR